MKNEPSTSKAVLITLSLYAHEWKLWWNCIYSQQVRGMATLKAISIRLKSVKNIQKITQSMKMVSAAKFTRADKDLKLARPYGVGAQQFFEKAEVKGTKPIKLWNLFPIT